MKVLCVINNIYQLKEISTVERLKKYIHLSDGQLNLEKNKEYNVYGVFFRDNSPWYYINIDDETLEPTLYPAEVFNITNKNLSSYWQLSSIIYPDGIKVTSLVFDEWAKDSLFYERLIDGDPEALALFKKYKILMDKE